MSVTLIGEMVENRTATARVLTRPNGEVIPVREYTRTYKVRTTDKRDGSALVGSCFGLPVLFDPYDTSDQGGTEFDVYARVQSITPKITDNPYLWHVEVRYSSLVGDEARGEQNPLSRPPEISLSWQKYQQPIIKDQSSVVTVTINDDLTVSVTTQAGKPIVNSAGEAFDPPIEADDSRPILTISRNEAAFDFGLALTMKDVINSDVWYTFPPYCAKAAPPRAVSQFESGFSFWRVTYEFEIRYETWWDFVLDQGFSWLDAATGKKNPFNGLGGAAPQRPVLLNGAGMPLNPGFNGLPGARTTLTVALTAASTTLFPVASGAVFGPLPFTVKIDSELILVSSSDGSGSILGALDLTRGYDGTTPAAHAISAVVQQQPVYLPFRIYREVPFAPFNLP